MCLLGKFIDLVLQLLHKHTNMVTVTDSVLHLDRQRQQPFAIPLKELAHKQAIEAIPGVRSLSPHSCRHTCVSQIQALGVDLATIQSLVGHADVDMTKHYLHVQDPIRLCKIII